MQKFVLSLLDTGVTLATTGGKGANLGVLARAGLPVPAAFLITTAAYTLFVEHNRLDVWITDILAGLNAGPDPSNPDALEDASRRIGTGFKAGQMPGVLAKEIGTEYLAMGAPAVAVRSSATAEDLPDLSFAGQQETFLNIVDADALKDAVVRCWASLWTARAIAYRARNAIDIAGMALGVVVQEMVQSEASGVLFTANPLTGKRDQTVIDAIYGLGEALVSGQVEPDQYIVISATGAILQKTLGAKAVTMRSRAEGGIERIEEENAGTDDSSKQSALPDTVVQELVALGARVQALYSGVPQDIEWAWAQDRLWLLQARPITSLFPLPAQVSADPPSILFSFGAVQGMLDPLTPVGQDMFNHVSAAFGQPLGYNFAPGKAPALHRAGERLWIEVTPLAGNAVGRKIAQTMLNNMEPGAARALAPLLEDAARRMPATRPQWSTVRQLLRAGLPVARQLARVMKNPDRMRDTLMAQAESRIDAYAQSAMQPMTLAQRIAFVEAVLRAAVQEVAFPVAPAVLGGVVSFFLFLQMAERAGFARSEAVAVARGLPHNVTTEMDLALWQVARTIQQDPVLAAEFSATPAATLAARYLAGALAAAPQAALADFMSRYGMRGIAEIDLGRRRWREDPTQVMQMVQNYLQITDPARAPDVVHQQGAQAADAAIRTIIAEIERKQGTGEARRARMLAQRARALAGLREAPKFAIMRMAGIARAVLLAGYAELAEQGTLENALDGVFLTFDELRALDAGYAIDWKALVRERKALYAREQRRRLIPRLLLGDGRAFYEGSMEQTAGDGSQLTGTPVSPGTVEGIVHVVFDPHKANLKQGEVLVCPGTDPAWTPLFLSAGALVMEVGGLMTHGSVVAREYGLPAVVGVANATERLQTGMRVRVDGSAGVVTILEESDVNT